MKAKKAISVAVGLAIIVAIAILLAMLWAQPVDEIDTDEVDLVQDALEEDPVTSEAEGGEYDVYENEMYGFGVRVLPEWRVRESFGAMTPAVNVLPSSVFDEVGQGAITHHNAITQASVFPQGVPSEGLFGMRRDATGVWSRALPDVGVSQATEYILTDGTPWAVMINLDTQGLPAGWNQAGFIFGRVQVNNMTSVCYRGMEEIPDEQCDPLTGDSIEYSGTVNEESWSKVIETLESFHFLQ